MYTELDETHSSVASVLPPVLLSLSCVLASMLQHFFQAAKLLQHVVWLYFTSVDFIDVWTLNIAPVTCW